MTIDDIDTPLIIRYLSGDCTSAERDRVDAWVAADPHRHVELDAHRRLVAEMRAVGADRDDAEPVVRRLRAMRREEQAVARFAGRRGWARHVGWSVGFAVIIVGAVMTWRTVADRTVAGLGTEYVTAAGQRQTVWLSDGTQLTLAPASRLRIAAHYGHPSRRVMLDGEGYFSVRHDAAHPFAVETRGVVVRDIGTTFDVRGYPEDSGTRVAVVEGVVAVNAATARAGDVLLATDGRVAVRHDMAMAPLTAWMQGALVFDKTPLRDVVRDIGRLYGVSITVADSALLTQRITGTFSGKPLDVVLTVVTGVVGAQFERTAQGVVIRRAMAEARPADTVHPLPLTTARAGDARP